MENDKADDIMLDRKADTLLSENTRSSNEITYRFTSETVEKLITGNAYLKEKKGE